MIDVEAPIGSEDEIGPPRRNGELVFESPWEARSFGIAIALIDSHVTDWPAFRRRLIAAIAAFELGENSAAWSYYARWLDALERLSLELELFGDDELAREVDNLREEVAHDHHRPKVAVPKRVARDQPRPRRQ
jgi:nitrile hydratase accessory protein